MAFGGFNQQHNQTPQAEINMVPLIDVMLVLLVIFMVTAPLLTHAVKVDLPGAVSAPSTVAEKIDVSIDAEGRLFWNATPVSKTEMLQRLAQTGETAPQTEIHLRVDKHTRYEVVAEVMAAAASAGLGKIGFVTVPAGQG
ncbi:MAG: ExbD/TolR family protein [Gammaproteobacteria bacterium]